MPISKKPKTIKEPDITRTEDGYVYYEKSLTKNLGNYESAKITIGVTLPIEPDEKMLAKIQKTFEIADELITAELEVQVKDVISKS
jgi:hypothetical protein